MQARCVVALPHGTNQFSHTAITVTRRGDEDKPLAGKPYLSGSAQPGSHTRRGPGPGRPAGAVQGAPRGAEWGGAVEAGKGGAGAARTGRAGQQGARQVQQLALLGRGVGRHVALLRVGLGVLQLGHDLARVAAGVEVVRVVARLLLGPSLAGVARVDQLVLVEVVVLVLVEVGLGHGGGLLCGGGWQLGEERRAVATG